MKRGKETKLTILNAGLEMASRLGLECVTIGTLASAIGMSKSGLFAHFHSKENLQVEILDYAALAFSDSVLAPALEEKPGSDRIRALVKHWNQWAEALQGGCIFVSASSDFSEKPGRVRERLKAQQETWISSLKKMAQSAVRAGAFRKDADCDQFAFELYSLLLGFHLYDKLLKTEDIRLRQKEALERLLQVYEIS